MTINLTTTLIIFSIITVIPISIVLWLMSRYGELWEYSLYIDKEQMFFFKSNPSTTCIILEILNDDYKKPNLKLMVTYNDGSMGELITPISEFQQLWVEC